MVADGTASMPARKISTLKAPAKKVSETQAQTKPLTRGWGSPMALVVLGRRLLTPK